MLDSINKTNHSLSARLGDTYLKLLTSDHPLSRDQYNDWQAEKYFSHVFKVEDLDVFFNMNFMRSIENHISFRSKTIDWDHEVQDLWDGVVINE